MWEGDKQFIATSKKKEMCGGVERSCLLHEKSVGELKKTMWEGTAHIHSQRRNGPIFVYFRKQYIKKYVNLSGHGNIQQVLCLIGGEDEVCG